MMNEKDQISLLKIEAVSRQFKTNLSSGLSEPEAALRQKQFGKNELPKPKRFSAGSIFFRQFTSPLIWFLFAGAFIALFLGEWIQMSAISAILLINGAISFFQEYRAERSFEMLKSSYVLISKVLREGAIREIPTADIVPGDIVVLESGDQVPADGRVIYDANLGVHEAALTGESSPIQKNIEPLQKASPIAEQNNMVFAGTHVVSGRGRMIVVKTGINTELGKIASVLRELKTDLTPLQIRFYHLGKQLVWICLVISCAMMLIGWWKGMGMVEIVLTSLSLAVAAIPEGLPAILTATLAIGVRRMAQKNVLIRKISSVETLGCTSVICADKTGTLTKNEMTVLHLWTVGQLYDISGTGYEPVGDFSISQTKIDPRKDSELLFALKVGVLCNHAELNQSDGIWKIAGDPTEGALLTAAAKANLWKKDLEQQEPFSGEIPFDSERKRMSVLRKDQLYVKGALESVLPLCNRTRKKSSEEAMNDAVHASIIKAQHHLASQGYRVLALAVGHSGHGVAEISMEKDLLFVGLVAMKDPPRPHVKEAIESCRSAGIFPVMITGDHKETAVAIAKEIGLFQPHSMAIEGKELDKMDEQTFAQVVKKTAVFARVSAQHKLRIIQAWKSHGQIVAMTGDGVNDAPAIKKADIGIAMGLVGTEVTKQASDMIILDDHFATIVAAVQEGRAIYSNIIKFVRFLLSSNFAELLVVFLGFFWNFATTSGQAWALLLPAQILWINLITDGFPAIVLAFDPVEKHVMYQKPRNISKPILSWSWIFTLTGIGMITAMGSLFAAYLGFFTDVVSGRCMAFTTLVFIEFGILFSIRRPLSIFSNKWLFITIFISILLQLAVIYLPWMQTPFGTISLDAVHWMQILGVALVANLFIFIAIFYRRKRQI